MDVNALLDILKIDYSQLLERDQRIPFLHHKAMLEYGASATKIPGIILRSGIQTTPAKLGIVGHLMMYSGTLLQAGQQISRFAGLLSESNRWSVTPNGDAFDIHCRTSRDTDYYIAGAEASLASCMGGLNDLAACPLVPQEAVFQHDDPGYASVYEEVFGVPVLFGGKGCRIRLSALDANRPIPHSQSYSADLLAGHAARLLHKLAPAGPWVLKVRQLISEHLAEGRVDIEWVSSELAMSRWTLARRLKQEGLTYNGLVGEIRRQLASEYLSDATLSISEVGFLLGYSEPSAFQRAFRGWNQCPPSEYRLRQ
ncbi:MAG: AraC family transcriptional regulator ligand-binding domain-containing protein [Halopseudomonas sp.]